MPSTLNAASFLLEDKPADRVALRTPEAAYSYGDLAAASSEFSSCLLACGAQRGDRVILLGKNSLHWAAAYLGTLQAEMVCVPLPATTSAQDLSYILATTDARFAFLQRRLESKLDTTLHAAGVRTIRERAGGGLPCFEPSAVEPPSQRMFVPTGVDDLAALMFTSGSTGKPRGVMVSHRNIIANATSILASLHLRTEDCAMGVLPFHYCFGTSLLHTFLRIGASLVVEDGFTYPEVVLDHIRRYACTCFAGVPSHYQILLRSSSIKQRALPGLRMLLQAGGHLAPQFLQELHRTLSQTEIFVMYGQTEATARLSCLPPEHFASKPGSIGKSIPGVTLHLLNASGEPVAPGEVGEIVAEGENVALGYWRAPQETALAFRHGRLHTGDLAKADEDGFLFIVDRAKEFVKCGGTRVSCRQIEDRLLECGDLLEAAVVGVPDPILGEALRAFVVPRDHGHPTLPELLWLFCKTHLPHNLLPRDFVILRALPKNSSGKVMRAELKSSARWDADAIAPNLIRAAR